jgi:hypothetical protein
MQPTEFIGLSGVRFEEIRFEEINYPICFSANRAGPRPGFERARQKRNQQNPLALAEFVLQNQALDGTIARRTASANSPSSWLLFTNL